MKYAFVFLSKKPIIFKIILINTAMIHTYLTGNPTSIQQKIEQYALNMP